MEASERAYVVGVGHADRLLAQGVPILGVSAMDAGAKFALSFHKGAGRKSALRWPVDTPFETVEADLKAALAEVPNV